MNQRELRTLNRDIQTNQTIIADPKTSHEEKHIAHQELAYLLAERDELYSSVYGNVRQERKSVIWNKRQATREDEDVRRADWGIRSQVRKVLPVLLFVLLGSTQACLTTGTPANYSSTYVCPATGCKVTEGQVNSAMATAATVFNIDPNVWYKGYSAFQFVDSFVGSDDIQYLTGVDAVYTVGDRVCPFTTDDGNVSLLHAAMHAVLLIGTGSLDRDHKDAGWAHEEEYNKGLIKEQCR